MNPATNLFPAHLILQIWPPATFIYSQTYDHGSTRSCDQISLKVRVRLLFYFKKYLPKNLENTTKHDRKRLLTSFE